PRSGSPAQGEVYLYVSDDGTPPNTALGTSQRQRIPCPLGVAPDGTHVRAWNAVSSFFNFGYRPLVLTRHGETPRPGGDFIILRWPGRPGSGRPVLLRTTALSEITAASDWDVGPGGEGPGVKAFQVGGELPADGIGVVQASGGHDNPTFYLGDVDS